MLNFTKEAACFSQWSVTTTIDGRCKRWIDYNKTLLMTKLTYEENCLGNAMVIVASRG